jgi:hypothetical protein
MFAIADLHRVFRYSLSMTRYLDRECFHRGWLREVHPSGGTNQSRKSSNNNLRKTLRSGDLGRKFIWDMRTSAFLSEG